MLCSQNHNFSIMLAFNNNDNINNVMSSLGLKKKLTFLQTNMGARITKKKKNPLFFLFRVSSLECTLKQVSVASLV